MRVPIARFVPCSFLLAAGTALICAAGPASALTVDAAKSHIHTVGSAIAGGWNLFSNGELGDYILFPEVADY